MSTFNGVKIFCATLVHSRSQIGDLVTLWLEDARKTRPGFQIADILIRQSSDRAYHCLTILVFFREDLR